MASIQSGGSGELHIYAIYNIALQSFVCYGMNGGGETGYCLYRGHKCFFLTAGAAQEAVNSFDNPSDYIIREFAEVEGA